MGKRKPAESSAEGNLNYPPRFAADESDCFSSPHRIEQEVQRELLSDPRLKFASLVIRRVDKGVCLQGVLEADENTPDVCTVAQRVAGVEHVLNHLVLASSRDIPLKG